MATAELVVLADEAGNPIGTALKSEVHTENTPLHLAFSCYVVDTEGNLLITRRALEKKTWPGVWTNSACGHLAPGETAQQAAARRVPHEIGVDPGNLVDLEMVLPDFRYRAIDSHGIVEWEICPVFVARLVTDSVLTPETEEIDQMAWVQPHEFFTAVDAAPFAFSPWMVDQLAHPQLREKLNEIAARA